MNWRWCCKYRESLRGEDCGWVLSQATGLFARSKEMDEGVVFDRSGRLCEA